MSHRSRLSAERAAAALERLAGQRWLLPALLILAAALRLVGLRKGLWLDEAFTLDRSLGDSLEDLRRQLRGLDHPPLFFVLLHYWARIDGSLAFLRLLPAAIGVGLVAAVFGWAERFGRLAAALAGLLVATVPVFLRTSHDLRGYGLLMLLAVAAFAAAERVRESRRTPFAHLALGAALAGAALVHHVGALIALPAGVLALPPAGERRPGRLAALAAALAAAGIGALAGGLLDAFGAKNPGTWWMPPPGPALVAGVLGSYLLPASQSWLPIEARVAVDLVIAGAAATLALVALVHAHAAGVRRHLLAAALLLIAMAAISWLLLPIFWDRTTLPALPLVVVAVAVSSARSSRPGVRLALMLGFTLIAAGFAGRWLVAESGRPLEPWSDVAARMLATERPTDLLVVYPDFAARAIARHLDGRGPARLVLLRPGQERAPDRVATAIARSRRQGWFTLWLVVRLDSTVAAEPAARRPIFAAVARERGGRPVRALLVTPLDAALVPELRSLRAQVAAELTAELGPPTATVDEGQFVELHFAQAARRATSDRVAP